MTDVLVAFIATASSAAIAGALLPRRVRVLVSAVLLIAASVCAIALAGHVVSSGSDVAWSHSTLLPLGGLVLRLTPLGALFVILSGLVGAAASLYWIGYSHHSLNARSAATSFSLFILGLLAVPMAGNVTTFLFAWELMALSSLALVAHDHARRREAVAAARWYAVMTQGGAVAITFSLIGLAAHANSTSFARIAASAATLTPGAASSFFLLALIGFASKSGAVPLHVWLPRAHAEAPGPVSALMSGAMVNLGVYGIILVGRVLLHGGEEWWWLVVSAIGAVTAIVGALYAATSKDVKRLLAYSTSDNMGLVLMALGASGLTLASGHATLASLALVTALVLVVNHSLFKSTLFFAAGSVHAATASRNMDELGGLARTMPVTSLAFLAGTLAVSAIPPLNGFAGEWLLFQSLLHSLASHGVAATITVTLAVAAVALTGGLTIIAFVKAYGITFLGRGRSDAALEARETSPTMRVAASLTALACVVTGVVPYAVIGVVNRALDAGANAPVAGWVTMRLNPLTGAVTPLYLSAALAGGIVLVASWRALAARRSGFASVATLEPWGSGRHNQTSRMQYTATSFGEPIMRVFDDVLRPDHDVDVSHVVESRYYLERISYRSANEDIVERALYRPATRALDWWARHTRGIANGSVHRYLAYGLVALVIILVVLQ
ncbi:MAG TPA: proton-conducting transporter membrane subunit [Acidimicrobiales bacterium]|nr:proton-conducting transporter membrane subunit [Acidimicrobiales bacterium]